MFSDFGEKPNKTIGKVIFGRGFIKREKIRPAIFIDDQYVQFVV